MKYISRGQCSTARYSDRTLKSTGNKRTTTPRPRQAVVANYILEADAYENIDPRELDVNNNTDVYAVEGASDEEVEDVVEDESSNSTELFASGGGRQFTDQGSVEPGAEGLYMQRTRRAQFSCKRCRYQWVRYVLCEQDGTKHNKPVYKVRETGETRVTRLVSS